MEQYQPNYPDGLPYWVKRIQQANTRNAKRTIAQTEEELKKLYSEQNEKLYNKLIEVFVKIANDKEDGKIYTNDLFLTNNYHLLIKYFNECAQAIGGEQLRITDSALLNTYNFAQQTIEAFMPKGMIQNRFVIPSAVSPEQAVNHVWCLDGKEFSDRIWQSKTKLVQQLSSTMGDFTAQGVSPFKLAQEITKNLQTDLYSAYRIARTETAHAQIQGQADKYKEIGFTKAIWLATDACEECEALDGQEFSLDEIQRMLPRHPNCTCSFLLEVGD